jgi:DNA (cytosine-5)-methyltransferase 1
MIWLKVAEPMKLLDLFCGMGGFAIGFARSGFRVTGYDINPWVPEIFCINKIGVAVSADLSDPAAAIIGNQGAEVVIGGPPCRPWSALNLRRPGPLHPDYPLLDAFFNFIRQISPQAFLMENVSRLSLDAGFRSILRSLKRRYDIHMEVVRYSDYGAATSRRRLVVAGFRYPSGKGRAIQFFRQLETFRRPAPTVAQVLRPYLKLVRGEWPDHEWPDLKTITRYRGKYQSGRYGWYRLKPDMPAPSFGNITKTYVLHPFAGNGRGVPLRVLSIREAMAIMGFSDKFRFPEGMGMGVRYQMVADAVSPVFSEICARVMKELLQGL